MKSNIYLYITLLFCFAHTSIIAQTETISLSNTIGEADYESKDHRSNIYEVVSDRKTINNNQFQGIIIIATDYYPYGSEIGARSFSNEYRYGFQGQEKDEEAKGKGNSINYKYRMHDTRIGRFFAVDPLSSKYPHYSSYQFSGNKVIQFVELEGLEEGNVVSPNTYTMKEGDTFWSLEEAWGMEHGTLINANPEWKGLNENGIKKTHIMPVGTVISIINVSSEVNSFPNLVNTRYSLIESYQSGDKIDSEQHNDLLLEYNEARSIEANYLKKSGAIEDFSDMKSYIDVIKNPKNLLKPPGGLDIAFEVLNPYKWLAAGANIRVNILSKKEDELFWKRLKYYESQESYWKELIEIYNNEYNKPHYTDYRWIDGNIKKVIIQGVRPKPNNSMPTLEQELRKDVLMWDD